MSCDSTQENRTWVFPRFYSHSLALTSKELLCLRLLPYRECSLVNSIHPEITFVQGNPLSPQTNDVIKRLRMLSVGTLTFQAPSGRTAQLQVFLEFCENNLPCLLSVEFKAIDVVSRR